MKVAIRTDASIQIGTGHVMRCLTLADELRHRDAEVVFVCREHKGNLCDLISGKGFAVLRLPVRPTREGNVEPWSGGGGTAPFGAGWLGATWQGDADDTVAALSASGAADWLVVDHYALDARWESRLSSLAHRILVIDDLADRRHECDLLLDQNFVSQFQTRYDALVREGTPLLLGPQYALLRREFLDAVSRRARTRGDQPLRLFVFFGGTDPTCETAKALRALNLLSCPVEADVVVGAGNPKRLQIASSCREQRLEFHCQIDNIAELMRRADLALGAGGATTWERCFLGLPALAVSVAANQTEVTRAVASAGAQIDLGWHEDVDESRFVRHIERLVTAQNVLAAMGATGVELMGGHDFRGAAGVVAAMVA